MKTLFALRPKTSNIGNDLIAFAADRVLQAVWKEGVNVVTLPAANNPSRRGGLSPRTVWEINQLADGLIVGPGNLFENGGLHVDPGALEALQVPLMILSTSTGRVFDRSGQLVARTDSIRRDALVALCRKASVIQVRDHATVSHLSELGIEGAQVVGCPVPLLELPESAPRDPALAHCILLSVREPGLMSIPFSLQGRMYRDVRAIADAFAKYGEVRLLCHDYQDLRFARAFPDVSMMYTEDARLFLHWLRSCRLNITFRLHAFLSCLPLGTPSIPLTYDERSISLVETLGFGEWPVDYIHCPDLISALEERRAHLGRLQELKQKTRPILENLRTTMHSGLERFASQVETFSASRIL